MLTVDHISVLQSLALTVQGAIELTTRKVTNVDVDRDMVDLIVKKEMSAIQTLVEMAANVATIMANVFVRVHLALQVNFVRRACANMATRAPKMEYS